MNIKKLFGLRVGILIFFVLMSLLVISPSSNKDGVIIKGIEDGSYALDVGLENPDKTILPMNKEVILKINDQEIKNLEDYSNAIKSAGLNQPIRITTNKKEYDPFLKTLDMGIKVGKRPTSNIVSGLELQGGTRVLLKPVGEVSRQDIEYAKANLEYRLNVYGLSDIVVKSANDLLGNNYIIIEIAGATEEEVRELVAKQGKFEAKIGDDVVFIGGKKDVTFVCRGDGTCSGIRSCNPVQGGENCRFQFRIDLSPSASKVHAEVTNKLEVNMTQNGNYLSKELDLYLDDVLVDSLLISADLKGKEASSITISGPGFGEDRNSALDDAVKNMEKLQTVLITGSLPFKLEIVKMDNISPALGSAFVKNIFRIAFFAILSVGIVIFIRYRKLKIAIPMMIATVSEVVILLGLAAFARYSLDLAAIAGILAAVGTGVDDQIVITDEVIKGEEGYYNWKEKIKKAFFIIIAAYATTVAAMIPLLRAGAGLLTGFALATIAGVTIGVLITRPAFAKIIEVLMKE